MAMERLTSTLGSPVEAVSDGLAANYHSIEEGAGVHMGSKQLLSINEEKDTLLVQTEGMNKIDTTVAKTTTTMFVPQSSNSQLFKLIREKEERCFGDLNWRVKVLEQPGTPLLTKFTARFPIREGCARGSLCQMCTGDSVKCTPKGVIYEGSCLTCKMNGNGTTHKYIGESSRSSV